MSIEILMPALSPTMTEGNLSKWLVKEGDKVNSGDVIAEIETDKATMEIESADEGTVIKLLIKEGTESVPVNSPIAVLDGNNDQLNKKDDDSKTKKNKDNVNEKLDVDSLNYENKDKEIVQEIKDAAQYAIDSPFPEEKELFTNVYL